MKRKKGHSRSTRRSECARGPSSVVAVGLVAEVDVGSGAALVALASSTSSPSPTLPLQKARSNPRYLTAAVILEPIRIGCHSERSRGMADSSGKCNRRWFIEYLMRGAKAKCFSRAVVESLHHLFDRLRCNAGEVATFGKILAHQTVGVLIESPLPGGIGMGKVEVSLQFGSKVLMACKLSPIVGGDGMHA